MKFVDTDILIDFYRNYQPAVAFLDYYYSMDEILAISSILISDGELFSKNASDFVFIENLNITRPY